MHLPDFLIDRYKDWKNNSFPKKQKFYNNLVVKGQKPKVMIISCCDSRVDPNKIFNAEDGEIFIHRNIANVVPSVNYDKINYETYSAIEYGINILKIEDLIILGHSNCGGVKHAYRIFSQEIPRNNKFIDKWIKNIKPAFKMLKHSKSEELQIETLEKLNIVNSISNLCEFSEINKKIKKNKLKIHGLWYEVSSANLQIYNQETKTFENIIYK